MIPSTRLSTTTIASPYLVPDSAGPSPSVDYELGGIALNDPTSGLQYQVWTLRTDGTDVKISAPNHTESVVFSGTDITEVSLAFDQNMRPFIAFVEGGTAKFRWWDSLSSTNTITTLTGASNPRCCLDDKRDMEVGSSDIILAYLKDGNLYFRAQRDRYGTEYLLQTGVAATRLHKVGMNSVGRLQFMLER